MLILNRRVGESIIIGDHVRVTVDGLAGDGRVGLDVTGSRRADLCVGESVAIAAGIAVTVTRVRGCADARLGVSAPKSMPIHREEVRDRIRREGRRDGYVGRMPRKGGGR